MAAFKEEYEKAFRAKLIAGLVAVGILGIFIGDFALLGGDRVFYKSIEKGQKVKFKVDQPGTRYLLRMDTGGEKKIRYRVLDPNGKEQARHEDTEEVDGYRLLFFEPASSGEYTIECLPDSSSSMYVVVFANDRRFLTFLDQFMPD